MSKLRRIELISLEIKNFKGVSDFTLKADGQSIQVLGDNETGKTTLEDALKWCLFHKDAKDREQFNWKPLDEKNNQIHDLVTSVKLTLSIDGKTKEFSKTKFEKWSYKRGTTEKYFKDETTYEIDQLELSTKKLYDEKVAEILDEDIFKYLTSVTYFNEMLSPQERRNILFKYFGTKTDLEIIQDHEKLHPLISIIGDETIKNSREILVQKKKSLSDSIKKIPVKIEGIQEALPDLEGMNKEVLTADKQKLITEKEQIENDLLSIKNGSAAAEKQSELRLQHTQLKEAESKHISNQYAKINGIEEGKNKLLSQVNDANQLVIGEENRLKEIEQQVKTETKKLEDLNNEKLQLTEKFDKENDTALHLPTFNRQTFDEHQLVCQTCKREYDQNVQDELRTNFEKEQDDLEAKHVLKNQEDYQHFIEKKNSNLSELNERGKEVHAQIIKTELEIVLLENQVNDTAELSKLKTNRDSLNEEYESVCKSIENLKTEVSPFEETKKYKEIMEVVATLEDAIESLNKSVEEQLSVKQAEAAALVDQIREMDEQLAVFTEYDRQQGIIEKLVQDERDLSTEKGEIETKLVLFDEFFITKVQLLEENINSHFKFIKFKLFDFYEEGGLNESICEPVVDGVPFRDLNNANRINAGLDVANTLMIQEGIQVPLFVDNAEAVTSLLEIEPQVIALYVSEANKTLKVVPVKNEEEVSV